MTDQVLDFPGRYYLFELIMFYFFYANDRSNESLFNLDVCLAHAKFLVWVVPIQAGGS